MEVLIYNPQTKQREGQVPEQVSGSWIAKLSEDAYTLAEADLCTKHEYFENVDHPKTICWIVGGADGKPRADATVLWYIDQTVAGRRQCCRAHKETVDGLLYRDILQLIGGKLPETLAESDCQRIEAVGEWLGVQIPAFGLAGLGAHREPKYSGVE